MSKGVTVAQANVLAESVCPRIELPIYIGRRFHFPVHLKLME